MNRFLLHLFSTFDCESCFCLLLYKKNLLLQVKSLMQFYMVMHFSGVSVGMFDLDIWPLTFDLWPLTCDLESSNWQQHTEFVLLWDTVNLFPLLLLSCMHSSLLVSRPAVLTVRTRSRRIKMFWNPDFLRMLSRCAALSLKTFSMNWTSRQWPRRTSGLEPSVKCVGGRTSSQNLISRTAACMLHCLAFVSVCQVPALMNRKSFRSIADKLCWSIALILIIKAKVNDQLWYKQLWCSADANWEQDTSSWESLGELSWLCPGRMSRVPCRITSLYI